MDRHLGHTTLGDTMARTTRVAATAAVVLVVTALSVPSFAADKATLPFVVSPGCVFCSFYHIDKGSLAVSSTTTPGANGVKFKFTLSGATAIAGAPPVNGAQFVLVLQLSVNGGPCETFTSPPFVMTNGKAKALFDGSTLLPNPIPEGGGSFSFCETGALMVDIVDGSAPARAGVRLGMDPD
jgi:hypothetical protein